MSDFDQQVDSHCAKLVESYRVILNASIVQEITSHHEELLCTTAVENIVSR